MNPDLYTDEYRNFKYLKCSTAAVRYYKSATQLLNSIQPFLGTDPNFVWQTRIEFVEQLLDLRNDAIYFVEPGEMSRYKYEDARFREIIKPVVFNGHPLVPEESRVATQEDIALIENRETNSHYYICAEEYFVRKCDIINVEECIGSVLKFDENPLVPARYTTYAAFFYDREWAVKYQVALTKFLRYNSEAVSTISKWL